MNSDTLKGQWKQVAGAAKKQWAKLTNDDWLLIESDYDRMTGIVQERYGIAREKAEAQIQAFLTRAGETKPVVTAREKSAAGL
ncbi:MAG: CsbD family protein [Panacagrimonas sp.]